MHINAAIDSNRFLNVALPTLKVARSLSAPSLTLYGDKKISDFRAREEQKEAEFNAETVTNEQKKEEEPQEDDHVTEIRNKILESSLAFVDANGWTRQTIVKGAEQSGYPGTVHGMFPRGGIELINYYYLKCNKQLVEEMRARVGNLDASTPEKVGNPKEFVCWAIKTRLAMIHPFIKVWPQALAILTLPPNVPTSLANMLTLVDDVCYYSGDRSVDVSILHLVFENNFDFN